MTLPALMICALFWSWFGLTAGAGAAEREINEENLAGCLKRDGVDLYGSVEFELRTEKGFADAPGEGSTTSNADASVDLGLAIAPSPWVAAELQVSWDDESPLEIDEAWVSLGNTERFPLYFTGGKMTLPFGLYESAMVSDPLTQEIGETKEQAALLGLGWQGLQASVYAYDGSTGPEEEGNGLKSYGANIAFQLGEEDLGLLLN